MLALDLFASERHGNVTFVCLTKTLRDRDNNFLLYILQMPVLDGLQASRAICTAYPKETRPYLVAVTANAMQGDKDLCLAAGMDDYIR